MKTSLYTVLCTVIRLAAVWLGVTVIFSLLATYKAVAQGEFGERGTLVLLAWAAIILLIAFLLWVYPGLLARLAAGKSATQIFESPIPAEEIQQIAMSVLGMWFAMTGLYSFASEILRLLFVMNMHGESIREANSMQVLQVVISLVRVAIGVALVIGSRGLVGVIRHLRESGVPAQRSGDEENKEQA